MNNMSSKRSEGAKAMIGGALGVGVTLVLAIVTSAFQWNAAMFSGTLLLISWVSIGFGLGEFLFNGRFRVLVLLLAVVFGLVGMFLSLMALGSLGFNLR
jgi:hypothetical protein